MADQQPNMAGSDSSANLTPALEKVNIHFLSPSPEVPNGRITLSDIELDTKVGDLKTRLLQLWPEGPPPERQRLIYQGRPLLNMDASLRSVVRSELGSTPRPDTFTIHLVVQSNPSMPVPPNNGLPQGLPAPPFIQPQQRTSPTPLQPGAPPQLPHLHPHHHVHPMQIQAQMVQAAMQNQYQLQMQHQLQAIQQQVQQNTVPGQHGQQLPLPPMFGGGMGPMALPGQQNLPNFQTLFAQQHQPRQAGGIHGIQPQGHTTDGAVPGHQGQPDGNPANVPHAPHRQTTVQEMIGPNGQRMRVTTAVETVVISRSGTPQPAATTDRQTESNESNRPESQNRVTSPAPATNGRSSSRGFSPLPEPPTFTPNPPLPPWWPTIRRQMAALSPSNDPITTAWIISGPRGPQGIVFSPEYGVFRSPSQFTPTRPQTSVGQSTSMNPEVARAMERQRNLQRRGQLQIQRRNQEAINALARRRADRQNQQNQDLIPLVATRAWLFIRLYVFALMFTEPGSWLRYIVLTGAVLFCCAPRNNMFLEQLRRLQHHVEGLVPLAAPVDAEPAREDHDDDEGANAQPGGADQQATGRRETRNPDPQETAQRLLREQNERNESWWLETTRRVERAVALFIASLIPGVGERHIRARQEAEAAMRDERRRQEEQQQQQQQHQEEEEQRPNQQQDATNSGTSEQDGNENNHVNHDDNAAAAAAPPPPLIQV